MDDVTICICTFRRDSIGETLLSLSRQTVNSASTRIIVVDNDDTASAANRIAAAAVEAGVAITYLHAPARNISIARNAAMAAVSTRWAAFIDDDEIAAPDWLDQLLTMRNQADAVIGRSQAVYGDDLPSWVAGCDFHSNRIEGRADNAYTSNALIDIAFVRRHGLTFRVDLGTTGGEDTLFFREFSQKGGRIVYCPESVVTEPVAPSRASMRWALRRRFRAGQTHGLLLQQFEPSAYRVLLLSAAAKLALSAAMALATGPGTVASRRWTARGALHAGAISYRLKGRIVEEYASGPDMRSGG